LPEDFEEHDEKIEVGFQPKFIQKIVKIGEVRSLEMNVYQITHHSENDPRISLSRDSFRLLAQYGIKRALILFFSENSLNYRLSLVTIDLKWEEGRRVKKEYSNPHRYSFFLGPETKTHTPETYLIKQGRVKDFEDLKKRFSIEVVNKDFYTQIAILFTKLAGGKRTIGRTKYDEKGSLILPSTTDDKTKKEFSVRLIGRLIFCWFLKKKTSDKRIALLSEELLSSKSVTQKPGFYHNILEPLFFETLNTPMKQRKKEYQIPPWSQIPFLNGGLFTPEYHDYYQIDQLGISKYINILKVPDNWLKELFDIFEIYNFTIDENTPVDVELSIEPEMLGRIFENLLAEINPETGNTARKATGSYYTPRPIVEYMVDESLKQYLLTKTNINENKISSLLAYEEEEVGLSESEKDAVIDALDIIKIIDPACGSGAFPMGILQKMLLILQKIDPESKKWLLKKLSKIDNNIVKKEITTKLQNANWNYVHKLGIIQSSIYGVDIQPIAVDISKLRFFLSLIVDEKIDDTKENRGIDSLPNLEFKFICANSLIGLPKKEPNQILFEARDDIKALEELRVEYLKCYGDEKKLIEKKFQEIQDRMFKFSYSMSSKTGAGVDTQTFKLSEWSPFSGEPSSWFDPEWMFGIKDGFDIVIANPPYIKEYTRRSAFDGLRNSPYYQGKMDLWYLFACKNIDFLINNMGILVFIAQNNWVTSYGASILRNKVLKDTQILNLIDFGDYKIFECAGIQTMVMIFQKNTNNESYIFDFRRLIGNNLKFEDVRAVLNKYQNEKIEYLKPTISSIDLADKLLTFGNPEIENLLNKVKIKSNFKLDPIREVAQGIVPNPDVIGNSNIKKLNPKNIAKYRISINDGVFVIPKGYFKNNLSYYEKSMLKPLYEPTELAKYYIKKPYSKEIIYLTKKVDIKQIPVFLTHLEKYREIMDSRRENLNGRLDFYHLHWPRDKYFFELGPKILSPRKCSTPTFAYTETESYVMMSINVIKTERLNHKYLVALLDSKLIAFWLKHKGKMQGNNYQIDKEPLINLPLLQPTEPDQQHFIEIVDKILAVTKSGAYLENPEKQDQIKEYEKKIDQMVYKLYSLTEDEIEIVENFDSKK